MTGTISNVLFFVASVGFILVAMRTRHQTVYSPARLRGLAGAIGFVGLIRAAEAVYEIAKMGNSQSRALELLTSVQLFIAAAFFIDAARRKVMRER